MKIDPIKFSKPTILENEIKETLHLLISDSLNTGQFVMLFEEELKKTYPFKKVSTFASYDISLLFIIQSLNIIKGSHLIFPSFTEKHYSSILEYMGYHIHYIDVYSDSGMINETLALKVIENNDIKAVFIDCPFYYPTQLKPFFELNIPLILDFSTQLGLELPKEVYIAQNPPILLMNHSEDQIITTGGKGCSVLTNHPLIVNETGKAPLSNIDLFITDLQAALGFIQLKNIQELINSRKAIAIEYYKTIEEYCIIKKENFSLCNGLFFPIWVDKIEKSLFDQIFHNHQVELRKRFKEVHIQKGEDKNYPNTLLLNNHSICLPIYPTLSQIEVNKISKLLSRIY